MPRLTRTASPHRPVAATCFLALALTFVGAAPGWAKLPALSDEAKDKAALAAAKTAWSGKVDGYKLCLSIDRTADHYRKTAKAAGRDVPAAAATPPCTDPGPFVPPVPAAAASAAPGASAPVVAGVTAPKGPTGSVPAAPPPAKK